MSYLPSFSSLFVGTTLFPNVGAAGAPCELAPLPNTLAWHSASYALDVAAGRRAISKAEVSAYLDHVCFVGKLDAKRPSAAAFMVMVRDNLAILASVSHFIPHTFVCDGGPDFASKALEASIPHAANDNGTEY